MLQLAFSDTNIVSLVRYIYEDQSALSVFRIFDEIDIFLCLWVKYSPFFGRPSRESEA